MYEKEKVDMRVKYTREWTFEALSKLLEHTAYNDIKITEIINKAGISRATFYRNFGSKDDIIKIKVRNMIIDFHQDMLVYYRKNEPMDEVILIQAFFEKVYLEEKVIDSVIKSNLEYLMVDSILQVISFFKDAFYSFVKANKRIEEYTMEMAASSAWILLSRWHKAGRVETASELSRIYLSAFKAIYMALFEERSQQG
jgi:AcrR family transcriptional regulator